MLVQALPTFYLYYGPPRIGYLLDEHGVPQWQICAMADEFLREQYLVQFFDEDGSEHSETYTLELRIGVDALYARTNTMQYPAALEEGE